jgi:hypothetical protein
MLVFFDSVAHAASFSFSAFYSLFFNSNKRKKGRKSNGRRATQGTAITRRMFGPSAVFILDSRVRNPLTRIKFESRSFVHSNKLKDVKPKNRLSRGRS